MQLAIQIYIHVDARCYSCLFRNSRLQIKTQIVATRARPASITKLKQTIYQAVHIKTAFYFYFITTPQVERKTVT